MSVADLEKIAVDLTPATGAGRVMVTADEAGRFSRFAICMQALETPPGTRTTWLIGNDIAGNRNQGCASLEDGDDWVWFIDDDHTFPPDILHRLLAHNVDIVAPLVLRRVSPFLPVACGMNGEHLDLSRYDRGELAEVEHTGSSGMLIRRRALERVAEPWFELGNGISEDVNFCRKARAEGLSVFVDLSLWMTHLTVAAVRAFWHEDLGRWMTGFDFADGTKLSIELGRA